MNGADLLCDTLLANGIDTCFANPGTSEMHFVAALDRKPQMRCILGLSEAVVTGAADGYARMADKPAATLLHLGPGLANGAANLHNARRARTPILNVVGDHAGYHLPYDAPLTSDIDGIARPFSAWVGRAESIATLGARVVEAIAATKDGDAGQISTLILPADTAWSDLSQPIEPPIAIIAAAPLPSDAAIAKAIAALKRPGALIILAGDALRAKATTLAQRISEATGARLRAEVSNRRIERGAGRVRIEKIPYPIDLALADLAPTQHAILIGSRIPAAFFAYPGKPSLLLPPDCPITIAAQPNENLLAALEMIAAGLGLPAHSPVTYAALELPDAPSGALTPQALGAVMARHMPQDGIFVDESLTNGPPSWEMTQTARPHDHITLTGGAIGLGVPMATGAALAAPGRKVVALQADGSGAYTLQGLWTQARERLDVVTLIIANRRYQILRGELERVGANAPGVNASRMLDLDDPSLDWVALAKGFGVSAVSVATAEELEIAMQAAMAQSGPHLIEMIFP